jgi:hypothetical protein
MDMVAEEIAVLYPQLFHITRACAMRSIRKYGLLSADALEAVARRSNGRALRLNARPTSADEGHLPHGELTTLDSTTPGAQESKIRADQLRGARQWAQTLNNRVYFWVDEASVRRRATVGSGDGLDRVVLVFDTLSIVKWNLNQVELSRRTPTGWVDHAPHFTRSRFSPLESVSHAEISSLRGGDNPLAELTVLRGVRDVALHLADSYAVRSAGSGARVSGQAFGAARYGT